MGTDIHAFAEVLQDGRWQCTSKLRWTPFDQCTELAPFFDSQNYALFAVLAGVCAEVRADPPIEWICPPRGLPADASNAVRRERREWGSDGFSESWLLAREVVEADWDAPVHGRARTSHEGYATLSFPLTRKPRGVPLAHDGRGPENPARSPIATHPEVRGVSSRKDAERLTAVGLNPVDDDASRCGR
ncbi:MAG: hypothetical protein ACI8PZ_001845 [Myxococcota bacterium]|jgi:hypothetical protein